MFTCDVVVVMPRSLTVFPLIDFLRFVIWLDGFEILLHKSKHKIAAVILAGEYRRQRLEGLENRRIPASCLLPSERRDRLPVSLNEGNYLFVLAEEIPRIAILYGFSLQIGDGCDAHLRNRRLRSSVDFESGRRAELASENVIHRERQKLSHLIADAGFVKELSAIRARHLDDVEITVFSAKIKGFDYLCSRR